MQHPVKNLLMFSVYNERRVSISNVPLFEVFFSKCSAGIVNKDLPFPAGRLSLNTNIG